MRAECLHSWHIPAILPPLLHGRFLIDSLKPCFHDTICYVRCVETMIKSIKFEQFLLFISTGKQGLRSALGLGKMQPQDIGLGVQASLSVGVMSKP